MPPSDCTARYRTISHDLANPNLADLEILVKWPDSPWLRESWNYPGLLSRGVGFLHFTQPVNPTFRPGFPCHATGIPQPCYGNPTDYLATGIPQPRQLKDSHNHRESRQFTRISRSARLGCASLTAQPRMPCPAPPALHTRSF